MTENNTKWSKGVSGNPKGRPKNSLVKMRQKEILDEIFEEAQGDAVLFQTLLLKRGKDVGLDLNTALKLSKELACYQSPKKSSIESKVDESKEIKIQYNFPEPAKTEVLEDVTYVVEPLIKETIVEEVTD